MQSDTSKRRQLDELLAPYETRPITRVPTAIAELRRGLALGAELNRLQGAQPDGEARTRLMSLYCQGQLDRAEFLKLAATLARGRFHDLNEAEIDGG